MLSSTMPLIIVLIYVLKIKLFLNKKIQLNPTINYLSTKILWNKTLTNNSLPSLMIIWNNLV